MVQEKEGRERPENVEGQEKLPEPEEFFADGGRVEEKGAEEKGADGNENGGGHDEDGEGRSRFGQERCEEVLYLGQVGECADVEAQIHKLQHEKEGLSHGIGDFGEFFGGCEDAGAGRGWCGRVWAGR